MGFQIFEHDLLSADVGYAFHPSAVQIVMQQGVNVKISDLHSQNKLGYLISVDMVWGVKQMDSSRLVKISG
jgi:aspartokinase